MTWLPLLAVAELAGAVGLLVGLKVAPLGIAAGVGLALYFVGAVAAHVRAEDKNVAPPLVLPRSPWWPLSCVRRRCNDQSTPRLTKRSANGVSA